MATTIDTSVGVDERLAAVLARVDALLAATPQPVNVPFQPEAPQILDDTGLTRDEIERLILKLLLNRGQLSGRAMAAEICLPFGIVDPLLRELKYDQLVAFRGVAELGDYEFTMTEQGRERAQRYLQENGYCGPAPVPLDAYLLAMQRQSIAGQQASQQTVREAFSDLIISPELLEQLGPAINSGRGMFLFGEPGNGKTSLAERITKCFGESIWIPHALSIDGEVLRLFDPALHEEVEGTPTAGLLDLSEIDYRWARIVRPTVIAGGELTMSQLEVTQNLQTGVCEAPLQLKSNCGTFVIDDFGRQRMPVAELLNRWIVPLEKRYDFLCMPSGKKIQVPFDQLIIFSTNLEPKDLVDGAFLRRIPYKIQVPDPTEAEFRAILQVLAPKMGFEYCEAAVNHLIEQHYHRVNRPFRSCQPRDLLLQIKAQAAYRNCERIMTADGFDFAVKNYFSVI